MNNLFFALMHALRRHRWLRLFGCAYLFSSLGNGLTQTLILGQLLCWQASPFALTLTGILATLPGFFGSMLGETLCRRIPPLPILLLSELAGFTGLLLPLYGLLAHSIPALLALQAVEAFMAGVSWPAMSLVFKLGLTTEELPAATAMETVIFASQVLLGTGAGVLLFNAVPLMALLAVDAISFLLCGALLFAVMRCIRQVNTNAPQHDTAPRVLPWGTLSVLQKRSLLLLPALAAVGAPAMALLPALVQQNTPEKAAALVLPLIFARSLGQLCGPLFIRADRLAHGARRHRDLFCCLSVFLGAYFILPFIAPYPVRACLAIFIAHLASNIVFASGTFSLLHNFPADIVPAASAKAWRWQAISAALSTLAAMLLVTQWRADQALYFVSLASAALAIGMVARYRCA